MNAAAPPSWQPGQELPAQTLEPVTRLQLIKYAGASGDFNPIHTIDQAAAEAGLPGVIQHGMLTMATMGLLFSPYLDCGFVRRFETRFTGMVRVGDVLTIGGRATGVESTPEGDAYRFEVYARNQDGQDVATGRVTFLVYQDRKRLMNASNEEEMNRDVWGIAESRHFMRLTPEQRAVVDEIMSELPWHVKDMRAYVRRKGYHINGADKMHKVLLAMQIVMEELKQRGLMPAESVNASDER